MLYIVECKCVRNYIIVLHLSELMRDMIIDGATDARSRLLGPFSPNYSLLEKLKEGLVRVSEFKK